MTTLHRPVTTTHGLHCSCGVFCGSGRNLADWQAHAEDRFLLDPTSRLDSRPIGESWHKLNRDMNRVFKTYSAVVKNFGRAMNPLTEAMNRAQKVQPRVHLHNWRTFRLTDGMQTKCVSCGTIKKEA